MTGVQTCALPISEEYRGTLLELHTGVDYDQRSILRRLVDLQYDRNDVALGRGNFRVRGDTIEIKPAYEETVTRVEMFGDTVDRITVVDPLTGETISEHSEIMVFPATHYVAGDERMRTAVQGIESELQVRLKDRKSTRLNSSHMSESRMPSSA